MDFYSTILKCSSLLKQNAAQQTEQGAVKESLHNISKVVTSSHAVQKATVFFFHFMCTEQTKNEMIKLFFTPFREEIRVQNISLYRVLSRDVIAAILPFLNKGTAANYLLFPTWCPHLLLQELNSVLMQTFSFVLVEKHAH